MEKSAIVLIDLQNEFLRGDGLVRIEKPKVDDLVRNIGRLVERAHANDVPIVWVSSVYGEWTASNGTVPPPIVLRVPSDIVGNDARLSGTHPAQNACLRNTPGARTYKPVSKLQQSVDLYVEKSYFSAFTQTSLQDLLKRRGITRVLV